MEGYRRPDESTGQRAHDAAQDRQAVGTQCVCDAVWVVLGREGCWVEVGAREGDGFGGLGCGEEVDDHV